MSKDDDGNKKLSKVDDVDGDIDDNKTKKVPDPGAKESTMNSLLKESDPGEKARLVSTKKPFENDKANKNTGMMCSKEGHNAVAQSKKMVLI